MSSCEGLETTDRVCKRNRIKRHLKIEHIDINNYLLISLETAKDLHFEGHDCYVNLNRRHQISVKLAYIVQSCGLDLCTITNLALSFRQPFTHDGSISKR
jgi:hypothetical protein